MITYRTHGRRCKIPRAVFSGPAEDFWDGVLDPVPWALVAYDDGEIIAWTRYEITTEEIDGEDVRVLWAAGTWVEPEYRGLGISHLLWGRLMQQWEPDRVNIRTITLGGRILSAALVRWFPDVTFEVAA